MVSERFFILRRLPLGDNDDVVTCLGRSLGRFSAVVKGSRRGKSPLAGLIEPPTELDGSFREGMGLGRLQNLILSRGFAGIGLRLQPLLTAGFLARLFRESLPEREPVPEVYQLFGLLLEALCRGEPVVTVALLAQDRLLKELGLGVAWQGCVACGAEDISWYAPERGGAFCAGCSLATSWPIGLETKRALVEMRELDPKRELPCWDVRPIREMGRIFKAQFQYYLLLSDKVFKPVLPKA